MRIRAAACSLLLGAVVGILVSIIMTALDWRLNPGAIFHDATGTHWRVVWDTAVSWFVPVTAIASVLAAPLVLRRLRVSR